MNIIPKTGVDSIRLGMTQGEVQVKLGIPAGKKFGSLIMGWSCLFRRRIIFA